MSKAILSKILACKKYLAVREKIHFCTRNEVKSDLKYKTKYHSRSKKRSAQKLFFAF